LFIPQIERPYQLSALMLIQNQSGTTKNTVCYAPTSSGAK